MINWDHVLAESAGAGLEEVFRVMGRRLAKEPERSWGAELARCSISDWWALAHIVRYALEACESGGAYLWIITHNIAEGYMTSQAAARSMADWLVRTGLPVAVAEAAAGLMLARAAA